MGDSSYNLLSPSSIVEKFTLDSNEKACIFSKGQNVVISTKPEEMKRERDSGRVETKILSEFKTDAHKPRLLTIHDVLIACHMIVDTDVIRIFNRETKNKKLIKNVAAPRDLQFATHAPLLASIDANCNLMVFKVNETCEVEKFIEITGWNPSSDGEPKISWCPYYPETPNDPDDCIHMLAIYKGKSVAVLNLSNIEDDHGQSTVSFETAMEVEEGVYSVDMESTITAACVSPDSTAIAIGTESGLVSFYVINEKEMKFAHNWNPRLKTAISHLHFLDSLNQADRKEDSRFWKACVAAGDNGRRLALYECVAWKCLGSLRFDLDLESAGFNISVDPSLRYIHILDVDGMNLFCVELNFNDEYPKFEGLTQITFCRPIYYLIPYDVVELEKDELYDESLAPPSVSVKYIALGSRSMMDLDVHLERLGSEREEKKEYSETRESIPWVDAATRQMEDSRTVQLQLPSTSDMPDEAGTSVSHMDREELEQRLNELTAKLDNLSFQVERAESERKASTTNENLLLVLQQFKEEFSLREDRLMANVSDLMETSRSETLQAVRGALSESHRSMESLVQTSHKHVMDSNNRMNEKMRDSLTTVVVPQIDRICGQLFKQLNENFRLGLEQYFTQIRALHSATLAAVASATPAPSVVPTSDRQGLLQMIRNNQVSMAFETVLNQDDQGAMEFVCKNVDPEDFFLKYRLPPSTVLSMIAHLSYRLDSETELRFRYLHVLFDHLRVEDQQNLIGAQPILAEALRHLSEFANSTQNGSLRSQAKLLTTIVKHNNQILSLIKTHLPM